MGGLPLGRSRNNEDSNLSSLKSILIVSHTNELVESLNQRVRSNLELAGFVKGKSALVKTSSGKELKLARGDSIVFKQNNNKLGVLNGELATVLSVKTLSLNPQKDQYLFNLLVYKADGGKQKITIDTSLSASTNASSTSTSNRVE